MTVLSIMLSCLFHVVLVPFAASFTVHSQFYFCIWTLPLTGYALWVARALQNPSSVVFIFIWRACCKILFLLSLHCYSSYLAKSFFSLFWITGVAKPEEDLPSPQAFYKQNWYWSIQFWDNTVLISDMVVLALFFSVFRDHLQIVWGILPQNYRCHYCR